MNLAIVSLLSLALSSAAARAEFNPDAPDPVVEAQRELNAAASIADPERRFAQLLALAEALAALSIPLTAEQITALRAIVIRAGQIAANDDMAALATQVGQGTAALTTPPAGGAGEIPASGTETSPTPGSSSSN